MSKKNSYKQDKQNFFLFKLIQLAQWYNWLLYYPERGRELLVTLPLRPDIVNGLWPSHPVCVHQITSNDHPCSAWWKRETCKM